MKSLACHNCRCSFHAPFFAPTGVALCPVCLRPLQGSKGRRLRGSKSRARRRAKIAERDAWVCQLCGGPVDPLGEGDALPTVDHILPLLLGGTDRLDNLQLAHRGCNMRRGADPLERQRRAAHMERDCPVCGAPRGELCVVLDTLAKGSRSVQRLEMAHEARCWADTMLA